MDTNYLTILPQTLTEAQKSALCSNIGTAKTTRVVGNIHLSGTSDYQGVTLDGITISLNHPSQQTGGFMDRSDIYVHYGELNTSLSDPTETLANVAINACEMPQYHESFPSGDDPKKRIGQAWPHTLYTTLGNNARKLISTINVKMLYSNEPDPKPYPAYAAGGQVQMTMVANDKVYRADISSMAALDVDNASNLLLNGNHYVIVFERLT
jgi:hypothetical protein